MSPSTSLARITRPLAAAAGLLFFAGVAAAADPALKAAEVELQRAFEGKQVTVKLDLPATSMGVDIKPGAPKPLDFGSYSGRIKSYGVALRRGESVMVTKVKLTPKLIEFQLGGGGYGTFGDLLSENNGGSVYEGKGTREKNLENDLKAERDPAKRRAISEELDKLRRERERSNLGTGAEQRQAARMAEEARHTKALSAGSRFNVRYSDGVPAAALTPEGFRAVLAEWVEFDDAAKTEAAAAPAPAPAATSATVHKGSKLAEVEAIWGAATSSSTSEENGMKLTKNTYKKGVRTLDATFVEGVLVRYSITEE